ncbi:MAG: alpha/beta hydrolase [Chloroflexi bacterium]|nr:alpha/beta hydrolase [Chloroflexota bacterium]
MTNTRQLIFIHGLEGSSQGVKARLLRGIFTGILTPDFRGSLAERMEHLTAILIPAETGASEPPQWIIIGSSFGGLMGALFTCHHPDRVRKLILLAPALVWPEFASHSPEPVSVPTVVYHGERDEVIPLDLVQPLAEKVFLNLTFHAVDDDHGLYKTGHAIDWPALVGS